MDNLPKYYTVLFNGVTDALDALARQDYGTAKILLIRAQQLAELFYTTGNDIETEQTKQGDGKMLNQGGARKPRPEALFGFLQFTELSAVRWPR